jgi:hypothetical protein
MKKITYFFLTLLFITSCNKGVKKENELQGEWNLTKITVFDYDGLSYSSDTTCTGSLVLNKELDTSFRFDLAYSITTNFSDTTLAKGKYELQPDGEYLQHTYLSVTNDQIIPVNQSRILFLSDAYLKWEFIAASGLKYHLIFSKK